MTDFNNILCVISGAQDTTAIRRALQLATQNQSRLTFAMGMPSLPPLRLLGSQSSLLELEAAVKAECAAVLEQVAASCQESIKAETLVLRSQGFLPVIQAVLHGNHDLLIKQGENPSALPR